MTEITVGLGLASLAIFLIVWMAWQIRAKDNQIIGLEYDNDKNENEKRTKNKSPDDRIRSVLDLLWRRKGK